MTYRSDQMSIALYTNEANEITSTCPYHQGLERTWADDLPSPLKDMVVVPSHFDVYSDYEVPAQRTCGRDVADHACYSTFRWIQTALRSDDDELFYETPVYVEELTSWRLLDARWLTRRTTVKPNESVGFQTSFLVSDAMPR
jgi:hypothetical protein